MNQVTHAYLRLENGCVDGMEKGTKYRIEKKIVVIGRKSEDNKSYPEPDICSTEDRLSRRHMSLWYDAESGHFFAQYEGTDIRPDGTYIKNINNDYREKMKSGIPKQLNHGDEIGIVEVENNEYLIKFTFWEGEATIYGTPNEKNKKIFDDGYLQINLETRKVSVKHKEVKLTKKEYELLELLVQNKGIPLSNDVIISKIWRMPSDTSDDNKKDRWELNALEQVLHRIRNKIEPGPKNEPWYYIRTISGVGKSFL